MQFLRSHCQTAWEMAVHHSDLIFDGLTDLTEKKLFVSSFQNALEILFKQRLLDLNDHQVLNIRKLRDPILRQNFFASTDLNAFFASLPPQELSNLFSSDFSYIFPLFLAGLPNQASLRSGLDTLQKLRNTETHFYVDENSYLTIDEFRDLSHLLQEMQTFFISYDLIDHVASGVPSETNRVTRCFFKQDFSNLTSYPDLIKNSPTNKRLVDQFPDYERTDPDDIPSGWFFYVSDEHDLYSIAHEIYEHHGMTDPDLVSLDFLMDFDEFYRRFILMNQQKMLVISPERFEEIDGNGVTFVRPYVLVSKAN